MPSQSGRGPGSASVPTRRRVAGAEDVASALAGGEPIVAVLVPRRGASAEAEALAERAAEAGIDVQRVGPRKFERLQGQHASAEILALVGPSPKAEMAEVMDRGGAVWLLTGPAYPGNVGFAIRIAEVSGADGLYVDNDFDHTKRREARRTSMRADRFMPLGWEPAHRVIDAALAADKTIIGVEDVGTVAPWETRLSGSVLFIAGGEAEGIPRAVLDRCHTVVRIPMAGFVASYNLQAALAVMAAERFRQSGSGNPVPLEESS